MKEENYSLRPGTLLLQGKYRIEATLGSGGFGITYRARHIGLEKVVAIKEFFMRGACDRDSGSTHVTTTQSNRDLATRFRNKFVKEARLIASLTHPGIVRVSDIFEENGTAYYVMDFIEGESLAQHVQDAGRLSQSEALHYIYQVADALAYIHHKKLLHLDVKPGNILLQAETGRAVLIDFGVAKQYDNAGEQTSTTPPAVSNGYSPIEQYNSDAGITSFTPATDIYALAATFYKLLTGVTPPSSLKLVTGELPLPAYPAGVDEQVKQAIDRCLRVRRERPQSIAEFLALLPGKDTKEPQDEDTKLREDDRSEETIPLTPPLPPRPVPDPKPAPNPAPVEQGKKKSVATTVLIVVPLIIILFVLLVYLMVMKETKKYDTSVLDNIESYDEYSDDSSFPAEDTFAVSTDSMIAVPADEPDYTNDAPATTTSGRYQGTKSFSNYDYTGQLLNGQPDGYGKATYSSGDRYEGYWSNGLKEGNGTYTWKDGDHYTGPFKKDKMHGKGTYYWDSGERYEGDFVNDEVKGNGVFYYTGGDIYKGEFVKGKSEGYGTYTWANGAKYVGYWKNDKQHGQGTYYDANGNILQQGTWRNGSFTGTSGSSSSGSSASSGRYTGSASFSNYEYTGQLLNGVPDGRGKAVFDSGYTYEGEWKNGTIEGEGKGSWKSGDRYEGSFKNGKMSGYGVYYYAGGDIYKGNFANDKSEGYGTYTWAEGGRYVGYWHNDKQHGQGTYYDSNGNISMKGEWQNGKFVE